MNINFHIIKQLKEQPDSLTKSYHVINIPVWVANLELIDGLIDPLIVKHKKKGSEEVKIDDIKCAVIID